MSARVTRPLAGLGAAVLACTGPPAPVFPTGLPGEVPVDVRVRVIARDLPPSWHPGRLIRSGEGCRVVTVATTRQQGPIVLRNMGQVQRLQLSQAQPPPDWWLEPKEEEGWTELDRDWMRNESDRCRDQYPADSADEAAPATLGSP